ncbi:MAG TPA: hypothetical protein GXX75_03520 [Clostridiales bacterium]|nr:hypothetical protein [Clostridiales bacterium]
MEVILNQEYEMNHLITRSGRFTVAEFQKNLMEMANSYKDFAVNNGEYMITTTKAVEFIAGEQVMDVEILMPVDYRMPVEEPYQFKEKVRLVNALYVKVTDPALLQETLNQVNGYITENKLQPITPAYLVQTKQDSKSCIEVYVGMNPNVL